VTPAPRTAARIAAWYRGLNPWLVDGTVAVLFAITGFVSVSEQPQVTGVEFTDLGAAGIALVLAVCVPFLFRRRFPMTVLIVTATAITALAASDYYTGVLPIFVMLAVYTVGSTCSIAKTVAAAAYVLVALASLLLVEAADFSTSAFLANVALFSAVFMFGFTVQSRRARMTALEERAVALEREQEEEARRAVADERLRIAQELHDVVAHSMGVIAVQAGVGSHVIDRDPAAAKDALDAISRTSRTTLTEIRRMLGVLRADDGAEYAPAPGLADLGRLVHEVQSAGVDVELRAAAERGEVPPGVDFTAYRIVQEALTNVLKHAGPARATVTIDYEPEAVTIEVADDGRGVNGRPAPDGHGLMGMRERVGVYGGTFAAGPRAGGGFHVSVRLPYGEETR
jgi:signal transduction histidine kinase